MLKRSDPQTSIIPNENFDLYKNLFVSGSLGISGGFIVQSPGKTWFDPKRKIRDNDVLDHLQQSKSVAVIPAYYPVYATLDLDFDPLLDDTSPNKITEKVDRVLELFQLKSSEYLQFTSPGFKETGNRHIIVPVTYKGNPASGRLIKRILGPIAAEAGVELFPNGLRKIRLPFGYEQYLLDPEDGSPLSYTWKENLYWLTQLDPVDLERYPFQGLTSTSGETGSDTGITKGNGEQLVEHGLQAHGTRHIATGEVARHYYFHNKDIDTAKAEIKNWLRTKHNGFSKEINKGNWRVVDNEVDAWVESTYDFFEKRGVYPTSVHNLQGWLTKADVNFVIDQYPGEWVKQKKLSRLLQHYRGRTGGARRWVPLHRDLWRTLVGNDYIQFRENLEENIFEMTHSYQRGKYSKRVLIRIPTANSADMLRDQEGRAVTDWREMLLMVFGDVMAAARASGANFQRFYEKS